MRNFIFFALAWLLLNLLQAGFTTLADDEAYYWLYSQHLDWGYFDHPPMVALFIALGSWIPGELGVRLMGVLAQVAGLSVVYWGLLEEEDRKPDKLLLFFGLAFLIPIFQVFGFISTPDAPLLLFSALFLFAYKQFLRQPRSLLTAALLGITIAGLFYSKYHGLLLVGFVVLSNLSLLLNPFFYLAGLVSLALFFPHLLWQYENGFSSFVYHLVERNSSYEIKYSLEYLLNLLLVYNPFLWPLIAPMLFRPRIRGPFERSLFLL